MKKYCKKDWLYNLIIISMTLVAVLIITRFTYIYGSEKDWLTQHSAIPEYFRQLFYKDHVIFPQFSSSLGAGENIYYYSYYGLYSPIILISYCLPFVSMKAYLIISSILIVIISDILFYRWIYEKYGTDIAFYSTLLFAFSAPLLFHSHRHLMFINYMPFMIMALFGVERFFIKKKSDLLIVSVFFMILTSFYFSVSGIIAVTLYAISYWLDITENFTIKKFFEAGLKYAFNIIVSVMLACFLLLPTLYALLNGRPKTNAQTDIWGMIIPDMYVSQFMYGSYSMGATAIFVVAIIYFALWGKKGKRFLSIALSAMLYFGIFSYAINGLIYMDGKVFIAFLPVGVYLTASFIKEMSIKEIELKKLGLWLVIFTIPIVRDIDFKDIVFMIDLPVTFLLLVIYYKTEMKRLVKMLLCSIAIGTCLASSLCDNLIRNDSEYLRNDNDYDKLINCIIEEDTESYRINYTEYDNVNRIYNANQLLSSTYSSSYNQNFGNMFNEVLFNEDSYRNCLIFGPSKNLIYNMYMGNKYIVGKDYDSKNYYVVKQSDKVNVYCNSNVRPIAYFTNYSVNYEKFNTLSYPYSMMTLYNNAVVENDNNRAIDNNISNFEYGDIKQYDTQDILQTDNDIYIVNLRNDNLSKREYKTITIPVPKELQDKVFFIRMSVDNSIYTKEEYWNMDVSICINGITNKLSDPNWKYNNNNNSFEYTISSNESIENIEIQLCDGEYTISSPEIYYMDYCELLKESIVEFKNLHIGNANNGFLVDEVLTGDIQCDTDGYLVTSIPYDRGFIIEVDHELVEVENVDSGFVGCELEEGEHTVVIKFQAPWFKAGLIISLLGCAMLVLVIIYKIIFRLRTSG